MEQQQSLQTGLMGRIFRFYVSGFRSMTLGRTLWKIILIKLIILFGVLKVFFFQHFLETKFPKDMERSAYVLDQMTQIIADKNGPEGGASKLLEILIRQW